MNVFFRTLLLLLLTIPCISLAQNFSFADKKNGYQIVYSAEGPKLDSIVAHLLANDIKMATGVEPVVITDITKAKGHVIVLGALGSSIINRLVDTISDKARLEDMHRNLTGAWEQFYFSASGIRKNNSITQLLLIIGSDPRGTAYGVFTISEKLGVSPWYWWADAPVKQKKGLILELEAHFFSRPPHVKYRGIFINDEDWGLQPWAAKTVEPETGDIGPKTYAKVFELLLRLKANLIWPAMHPCTKAFFSNPENKKVAEDYGIVIGTSHAEPMLRNNVGEWDEKTMGPFNYITNKEKVVQYWEDRIKGTTANDVLYTMGMRGVHDSGIEGVKSTKEAVPLLEQIIKDQRGLLEKYRGKKANAIPQVFTAYKEVLDIYDNGLKIPGDITLIWPDDNYGYIQRLNTLEEQKRPGGSGVYYHASYWGRPHDYLWLSSTHPGLMCEEMTKAWDSGARDVWVLNVGDIKPLEFAMDVFMDIPWARYAYVGTKGVSDHLNRWLSSIFGELLAPKLGEILLAYYQLSFERKPEFMGWSRTEPTTKTTNTEYNNFFYGDEAQRRIDQYRSLEKQVKEIRSQIKQEQAAAFYQLVYYPVMCASWMNKKFLYRDKAIYYAKQNRLSAKDYARQSRAMYVNIVKETDYYNKVLSGGKWKNMMSMKPRDLPVYQEPTIPDLTIDGTAGWSLAPEGFVTKDSSLVDSANRLVLPAFDNLNQQRYFIDVFLSDNKPVKWTAIPSNNWIHLSKRSGSLAAKWGKNQERIWVDIDWTKVSANQLTGNIVFKGRGKKIEVTIQGFLLQTPKQLNVKTFVENNGFISMHAASGKNFGGSGNEFCWRKQPGLGYTGNVLQVYNLSHVAALVEEFSLPAGVPLSLDSEYIKKHHPRLEYDFYTFTSATPVVTVFTLPTHPVNKQFSDRYAVSVDDGPLTIVDFKTEGRSEEWKRNVLSNRAAREIKLPFLKAGAHTLKIYSIDPGVMLDEIRIDLGGLKKAYSVLPETIPVGMRQ